MTDDENQTFTPVLMLSLDKEFDLEGLKKLVSDLPSSIKRTYLEFTPPGSSGTPQDPNDEDCLGDDCEIFQSLTADDPPLSCPYIGQKFYVRECYGVYYELLMACLNSEHYDLLTVMGTPGTGKSLFYIYVFNRFRRENPSVTIVVATFDYDNMMLECWVYEPGRERISHEQIPKFSGALYLFDGPPLRAPKYTKMVCFTSPNYEWLRSNKKKSFHVCLRFPVWTLEELLEANEVCELGLSEETIRYRYKFFGGSARYCLSMCDGFVRDGMANIHEHTLTIDTFDTLNGCLRRVNTQDRVNHHIFHLMPIVDDEFPYVFLSGNQFVCSKTVDSMIRARICEMKKVTHKDFVHMIRGHSTLSQVRGVMFENLSHDRFSKGGTYELKALDDCVSNITVQLSAGAYEPAMKPGCESVDGVAVENDVVYLFQMTVSDTHPVNANGILERLKQLDRFDRFIQGNQKVCLVFVRPTDSREYKRQSIVTIERMDSASPVRRIPKMRSTWAIELARENVYKIDELIQYAQTQNGEKYRGIIAAFMTRNFNAEFNDAVRAIPQYELKVAECDERDKSINDLSDEIRRLRAENERLQRILVERLGA